MLPLDFRGNPEALTLVRLLLTSQLARRRSRPRVRHVGGRKRSSCHPL